MTESVVTLLHFHKNLVVCMDGRCLLISSLPSKYHQADHTAAYGEAVTKSPIEGFDHRLSPPLPEQLLGYAYTVGAIRQCYEI